MPITEGLSPWLNELDKDHHISCLESLPARVGILIIGGGLTGTSMAYQFSLQNRPCLVVDAREVCGGSSGRNGGILWPASDDSFQMRTAQRMVEFIQRHAEDAMFERNGGITLVETEEEDVLPNVTKCDPVSVLGASPGHFECGYLDTNVGSFWVAKVVRAFAKASKPLASYMQHCTVKSIEPVEGSSEGRQRVTTDRGSILCNTVIVATNAWIPQLLPELQAHLKPVVGTVLCSGSAVPHHLRWPVSAVSCYGGDSEVYINQRKDGRILLGGLRDVCESLGSLKGWDGGDQGPVDPIVADALQRWFELRFPAVSAAVEWDYRWCGLIAIPSDGIPIVGAMPGSHRKGVYVCGGYAGEGTVRCMGLAGSLVASICGVEDGECEYATWCDVDRFDLNRER